MGTNNTTCIDENELARRLGCSVQKLQGDRRNGNGCPWIKIGRLVRYRVTDVEAWINASTRGAIGGVA
jgi:hypothetical protein